MILAVGLNPVQQKSLIFPHFAPGEVNRARAMVLTPGGKGIHTALAANRLEPGAATVAHFLGGDSGLWVDDQLHAREVPQLSVRIAGDTRGCTTILCEQTQTMTELIEPSPALSPAEVAAMRSALLAALPTHRGIALCGTFPAGVGPDLYADLAAHKGQALVLLDAYRDIEATLATGKVDILKINRHELRELTGEADRERGIRACFARWSLTWVACTDGGRPAWLASPTEAWAFTLPQIARVVNPIGAGDTVTGVFLLRLLQGATAPDAFAEALASASASCLHLAGAEFDPTEAQQLLPQVQRTRQW